jgi:short-subunit dehydrogenase
MHICFLSAVVGTVEELSTSTSTLTLVRDQFETNFFSLVNIIKAALPHFRERKNGHILILTAISTSGLSDVSRFKSK